MTNIELDTNFFMGGNATFTVESPNDKHYTYKIRQPRGDNKPFFIALLKGPNNEADYVYLGMAVWTNSRGVQSNTQFEDSYLTCKLTRNSRMTDDSQPVKVVRWALKHATTDKQLPDEYTIHHEGKCGCCGRTLTVPESIKRGIGPECWSRIMGGRA